MRLPLPILCAIACVIGLFPLGVRADVVDVPTRDTEIRVLIEGPSTPSHVVAIFSGGSGFVKIKDDGTIGKGRGNFAVRTRTLFHEAGMATAVLSTPGDNKDLKGNRTRDDYARDVEAVMAMLRDRFPGLPLWTHGTSRGAISIASTVPKFQNLANRPDGIILSSPVTERSNYDSVFEGDLKTLAGPVLVAYHRNDSCYVTPPSRGQDLLDALVTANPKRLRLFDGGDDSARGNDCGPKAQHGFIDIEAQVIDAFAAFIKAPN